MNAAAMNADPPIRANAPANPAAPDASQVTKLKLAGFNIEPASAISRFTPKNLPRASGGGDVRSERLHRSRHQRHR